MELRISVEKPMFFIKKLAEGSSLYK